MSDSSAKTPGFAFALIAITLSTFLLALSMGVNSVILPFYMETSPDFSEMVTSSILAAEFGAALIFCILTPRILKRVSLFNCFLISTLCRGFAVYFLTVYQSPLAWFLLSLVLGVGNFAGLLLLQTWINSMPRVKFSGLMTACYGTAISVGVATAPAVLNFLDLASNLTELEQCTLPLKVSMIVTVLAFLPIALAIKALPFIKLQKPGKIFRVIKENLPIMLAIVVSGASFYGTSSYIVIYGMRNNLTAFDAALLLSAFMLGSLFMESPLAWLTDFVNRKLMLVCYIFLCIIAAVCLPFSIYYPWYARLLLFVWGGINGAIFSTSLALTGDRFKEDEQVTANSAMSLMENMGAFTATLIIGFTMKNIGTDGLPYTIMIFCLAYITYVLTRFRVK